MELTASDTRLFGFDDSDAWLGNARDAWRTEILGSLGSFELIEEVGRGGQGVVFRAVQRGTGRQIALKRLLAGSFASSSQRRRFEREVEAAATLSHPGVVTVYGAEIVDGLPVLAMEWIDGVPITDWARRQPRSHKARRRILEVFVELCEAVQHAHQRGVLHRDLKPSNVLVDAAERPRVLDFGLAKFVAEDGAAELSRSTEVLGTPAYAAPEQLTGRSAEVDSRSDVYSLGVILFELLTGRKPFEGSVVQVLTHSLEKTPVRRPSLFDRSIGAELDAITLQALARERERRYQSVDALAADVNRFLAGEAVLAHPPGAWYLLRKLVAKHRAVAALLGLLVALSAGYAWLSLRQARRLADERDRATEQAVAADAARTAAQRNEEAARQAEGRAQEESRKARATLDFLVHDVLGSMSPFWIGHDPTVADVLNSAVEKVGQRFAGSVLQEVEVRRVLTDALMGLGQVREAEAAFRPVLEFRRAHPEDQVALGFAEQHLAQIVMSYNVAEAEELLAASVERLDSADPHPGVLALALMQSGILKNKLGRLDEAMALLQRALDLVLLTRPSDGPPPEFVERLLADTYISLGDFERAVETCERALASERKLHGETELAGRLLSTLGSALRFLGDNERGVVVARESFEIFKARLGPEHEYTITQESCLGLALTACKQFAEAEELLRHSLELQRRRGIPCELDDILLTLGAMLSESGRYEEAEPVLREALQTVATCTGTNHVRWLTCAEFLGRTLAYVGKYDEATELLDDAVAKHEQILGERDPDVAIAVFFQAELARETGDRELATELYETAAGILEEHVATGDVAAASNLIEVLDSFARFERDGGNLAHAETLERRSAEAGAMVDTRKKQRSDARGRAPEEDSEHH